MKFTVSSSQIYSQLQAVSKVIASKNTLAILDCILFDVQNGKVSLTASDQETTLVANLPIENQDGEGKIAINARWIINILKEFSDQPIIFDIDETTYAVRILSDNGVYNSVGQNGDQYPVLPPLGEDSQSFLINSTILSGSINRSIFGAASEETLRQVLNGIYFDVTNESITVVATDACKLVRIINNTVQAEVPTHFILPKKPANVLRAILAKEDCMVEVKLDRKNIVFSLPNYELVALQVEGNYPNYNAVLPKNNNFEAIVNRSELISALKRVSVCAAEQNNLVKLCFDNNDLTISAQDIDFSVAAKEHISCQFTEEPITIDFKSTYLIDIVNNISCDEIRIKLANSSVSALFLPLENLENEDVTMLLMPMMIN